MKIAREWFGTRPRLEGQTAGILETAYCSQIEMKPSLCSWRHFGIPLPSSVLFNSNILGSHALYIEKGMEANV